MQISSNSYRSLVDFSKSASNERSVEVQPPSTAGSVMSSAEGASAQNQRPSAGLANLGLMPASHPEQNAVDLSADSSAKKMEHSAEESNDSVKSSKKVQDIVEKIDGQVKDGASRAVLYAKYVSSPEYRALSASDQKQLLDTMAKYADGLHGENKITGSGLAPGRQAESRVADAAVRTGAAVAREDGNISEKYRYAAETRGLTGLTLGMMPGFNAPIVPPTSGGK